MINWKEVYPQHENQSRKNPSCFWRDVAIQFGSGEEVHTFRIQQSWRRKFTVSYYGNPNPLQYHHKASNGQFFLQVVHFHLNYQYLGFLDV